MPDTLKVTLGKLKDAWRDYPRARAELARFPEGPPIFVSGTHRSGTTWVAKMLAVPGLWYVHEPFNPNKNVWREPFSYVPIDGNDDRVDRHMQCVLKGGFRQASLSGPVDHPLMPLRLLSPPIRRAMVKDPLACLLTGYLTQRFHLQTLVLFRHPCGFVSSIMRLGWPTACQLKEFLTRPRLMSDHLAPHADLLSRYSIEDSYESAAVLHGVLNLVLWRQTQQLKLRWIRFEDLCASPLERFAEMFEWLQLPYSDSVRQEHVRLCLSGSEAPQDYHTHAVARQSQAMAASWRRDLKPDVVQRVRDIWRQFEIPLYVDSDEW
jgi:hypothetical protein